MVSNDDINELSRMISEDVNESPLITVPGFGQMTKQQALNSTITYLRQMAEQLEQGAAIPLHYFDMAKDHYQAFLGESVTP
jgi:predicted deacetylase